MANFCPIWSPCLAAYPFGMLITLFSNITYELQKILITCEWPIRMPFKCIYPTTIFSFLLLIYNLWHYLINARSNPSQASQVIMPNIGSFGSLPIRYYVVFKHYLWSIKNIFHLLITYKMNMSANNIFIWYYSSKFCEII